MDDVYRLPGHPKLAMQLIEGLMDQDVDVSCVASVKEPSKAGFGHAYGFIIKRLFRRSIPVVPVLLNTYFPPNVPTAARCYDVGSKMRAVVEAIPGDQRIAFIASGGLSHFVVDEAEDLKVMQALHDKDAQTLRSIPRQALKSGSSETLNWILTAGAVENLPLRFSQYQPLYRTEAGTGVGAAFCVWSD
jgi:aromatic ring-opening dioxygenase catalytic subunit (LigB family)